MRKEIIETGKTVDAAIESACEKLGCDRETCEWEIVDLPKRTFLGLKTIPAKVKVWIDLPEEKKAEPVKPIQQKVVSKPERKPRPMQPQREQGTKPEPKDLSQPERKREADFDTDEPPQRIPVSEGFTEKEQTAMAYVQSILKEFGLNGTLQLAREGNGICIDIVGNGLGTIIGRRGETLDAIQYLTGLVANRLEGDYLRVTVDCGDYRTKRKDTLEALAKKLATQVIKTNISKTLEPMNPFERRVIHATVSKIEGVSSSSIGEEPNRRVVITSPTARRPSSRGGYGRERGGDFRDAGDRRRRPGGSRGNDCRDDRRGPPRSGGGRPSAPSSSVSPGPPKQMPEAQVMGNAPIGKLDLE